MSETYSETAVVGTISPLASGTRLRVESNTYSTVRASYGVADVVTIDLIKTCLVSTDRAYVHAGDQWARVVSINGVPVPVPSWMAIKYNGDPVCSENWVEQGGEPIPSDKYEMDVTLGVIDAIKITGPAAAVYNMFYNDVLIAVRENINVEINSSEGVIDVTVNGTEFVKPEP